MHKTCIDLDRDQHIQAPHQGHQSFLHLKRSKAKSKHFISNCTLSLNTDLACCVSNTKSALLQGDTQSQTHQGCKTFCKRTKRSWLMTWSCRTGLWMGNGSLLTLRWKISPVRSAPYFFFFNRRRESSLITIKFLRSRENLLPESLQFCDTQNWPTCSCHQQGLHQVQPFFPSISPGWGCTYSFQTVYTWKRK